MTESLSLDDMSAGSPTSIQKDENSPIVEAKNDNGSPPSPDGGFLAWIQCLASFCIFFNTFGLLNSFGVFQSYYEQNLLSSSSASQISWIGTIQSSFIMLGSIYSGPLYDWGYARCLTAVGFFMLVFGMFMTSLGTKYWQQILSQGLVLGIGSGCLFMPSVGIVASYFTKRRGLAMGIATSGSTIGGIIYPILFSRLVGRIGFGWSVRCLAFIILFLSIVPVLGVRMRSKPPAVRRIFEKAALKEPEFILYTTGLFIGYMGTYIPYFYIQLFALKKDIITGGLNFYLLPIMNAAGFFGRIVFGYLGDRIGPLNSFSVVSGACAALLFGWMGIHSEVGLIVFCVLYGFFSAGLITLPAMVLSNVLCPDMRQYGVRMTMLFVPAALGLLIGNPIAGAILSVSWLCLQGFAAGLVSLCTLLAIAARVTRFGWSLPRKC